MEKTTQLLVLLLYSSFLIEGLRVRKKKVEIHNNTSASDLSSKHETRGARFLNMLSLFTLVSFDNTDCTTSSGTQGIATVIIKPSTSKFDFPGTCFTANECSSKGGEADGNCAQALIPQQ